MHYHQYIGLNILVTLSSVVLFYSVTRRISYLLSKKLEAYKKLSQTDKIEWDKRNGSGFHGLLCCILGGLAYYYDGDIVDDPVRVQSKLSGVTLSMTVGYMIADVAINTFILKTAYQLWDVMAHHIIIAFLFGINIIFGWGCGFSILRLFAELSTPFLTIRAQLYMIGKKRSKIAFYNNLLFALTFFISRILFMPYFWLIVMQWWDTPILNSLGKTKYLFIFVVVIDILNILWFKKIVSAIIKSVNLKRR